MWNFEHFLDHFWQPSWIDSSICKYLKEQYNVILDTQTVLVMRNLRKPCSIIHIGENHGFYGGHFEIDHNDQLLDASSI